MYSDIKSVQILVALLKEHNIKRVVVSPGNRNVPIVHSLETDDFFTTYSVIDERSAGFYGIGLIHKYREPVAICCTSGTAVCNYYSAISEAYYQKLPLLVLTADRNPYYLNRAEDQMLPQAEGFQSVTKKVVNLPMIKDDFDEYVCQRQVNEAILALNHHGSGPVQINIPMEKGLGEFNTKALPKVSVINRWKLFDDWKKIYSRLIGKKILVLYGQSFKASEEDKKYLEEFSRRFGAVISTDILSNLKCEGAIDTFTLSRVMDAETFKQVLCPDICIMLNSGIVSYVKNSLKNCKGMHEFWTVNGEGALLDPTFSLKEVFECAPMQFIKKVVDETKDFDDSDDEYLNKWKKKVEELNFNNVELEYSDLLAVKEFANGLCKNSNLHVANSSSVRLLAHYDIDQSINVYCNRGTNGIDGSASSYMGLAGEGKELNYLLIGDLSFFYDMNSLWNNLINNNMRILLNNNAGATLFHYIIGKDKIPTLNRNIAAEHTATAKGWVESRGFKYIAVNNKKELDDALKEFNAPSEKPIFIEVFSDKEQDALVLKKAYSQFNVSNKNKGVMSVFKKAIRGK